MQAVLAVMAMLSTSAAADSGVHLSDSANVRHARLVDQAPTAEGQQAATADPFQLGDIRLASNGAAPLDDGGAMSADLRQILALILGIIPGFGIGHLVARDRD